MDSLSLIYGRSIASCVESPQNPTHEVVLVDPFHDYRLRRYSKTLQSHVASAVETINAEDGAEVRLTLKHVGFSISDAVAANKEVERSANKLYNQLAKSYTQDGPSAHRTKRRPLNSVIFVTHSMGALIVASALSKFKVSDESKGPAGLVLLDAAPGGHFTEAYLLQLSRSFGLRRGLKSAKSEHKQETLQIDSIRKNSATWDVWLRSESVDKNPVKRTRSARIKDFLHRRHDMARPEAIKDTPMVEWLRRFATEEPTAPNIVHDGQVEPGGLAWHGLRSLLPSEKASLAMAEGFWTAGELINAQNMLQKTYASTFTPRPVIECNPEVSEKGEAVRFILWLKMTRLLLDMGDYTQMAERLRARDPKSSPESQQYLLKHLQAQLDICLGKHESAISILTTLLGDVELASTTITHLKIHQHLAYAKGMLGQCEQASKHIYASFQLRKGNSKESLSLLYTQASLAMLRCDYSEALNLSRLAMRKYTARDRDTSLGALRSGVLHARVLVQLGDLKQASSLCHSVMNKASGGLGRLHPLRLEAIEVLVFVLRLQGRLLEALATSKSLVALVTESAPQPYPLAVRALSEVAATHLALGNFNSAHRGCKRACKAAEALFGPQHPETLRCRAEYARALCYCGEFENATQEAMETLKRQHSLYIENQDSASLSSILADPARPESHLNILLKIVLERVRPDHPSSFTDPNLLSTLHIIATIKLRAGKEGNRGVDILTLLHEIRKQQNGPENPLTLHTEYDLASALNNIADGRLQEALDMFRHVWESRCHLFGPDHPDTLVAERAIVLSSCSLGIWDKGGPARRFLHHEEHDGGLFHDDVAETSPKASFDSAEYLNLTFDELQNVQEVSTSILLQQEELLGPHHPDTLMTMLWLLIVQIHLQKTTSSDGKLAWYELRSRLRSAKVREERLISALRTEQSMATIFMSKGYHNVAVEILQQVASAVEQKKNLPVASHAGGELAGDGDDHANSTGSLSLGAALRFLEADVKAELATMTATNGRIRHPQVKINTIRDSGVFMS
ncbi:FxSxx-COOH system tetratricopeptide repeat protein [Microdochium nivale]|nr:FxSxx-COOH system tetratricopeptide repeat protein [Microdochium nivale]